MAHVYGIVLLSGWIIFKSPPGYENTDAGYERFQAARETPALAINEVVVFNRLYPNNAGEYNDLIELLNTSDEPEIGRAHV